MVPPPPPPCPVNDLLSMLSGAWTTYLLWLLRTHGALRFGGFKRLAPQISAKVLTERLRRLEADGLIHRDYQPTIPPAVTYSLTARGHELQAALDALAALAMRWRQNPRLAAEPNSPAPSPASAA